MAWRDAPLDAASRRLRTLRRSRSRPWASLPGQSEDGVAVHLAGRVGDVLDAGAVGIAERHRDVPVHLVDDAGVGEPLDEPQAR